MKTSELAGAALDWAVAKCEGVKLYSPPRDPNPAYAHNRVRQLHGDLYLPSTDWAQGGPIIEREEINIDVSETGTAPETKWVATITKGNEAWVHGPTPLIAAMRCYVASKFGDTVDVPEELLK
jgi:hypothetical protein